MTVDKEAILESVMTKTGAVLFNSARQAALEAMDSYAASLRKERDELKDKVEWWKKETNTYREGCRNRDAQIGELNLSNEAKEKRIEELSEALTNTEKAYEIMRNKSEYWKQRCESAEILVNSMSSHFKNDKYSYKYWNDWQALKNKTQ